MKHLIIILLFTITVLRPQTTMAQGCVAIKGTTGVCSKPSDAKGWEMNINTRYFKSYKHYVGTEEQKQRVEAGSNVINHATELDITATRTLNSRWSLAMTLPILNFGRSSLYEHDGKKCSLYRANGRIQQLEKLLGRNIKKR